MADHQKVLGSKLLQFSGLSHMSLREKVNPVRPWIWMAFRMASSHEVGDAWGILIQSYESLEFVLQPYYFVIFFLLFQKFTIIILLSSQFVYLFLHISENYLYFLIYNNILENFIYKNYCLYLNLFIHFYYSGWYLKKSFILFLMILKTWTNWDILIRVKNLKNLFVKIYLFIR